MALPDGIKPDIGVPRIYGCALALYAADRTYEIEIQRAPDDGGSPDVGNAETIAQVPGSTSVHIDEKPGTGVTFHYRIRHVRTGETASSWTPWVAIVPSFFAFAWPPAPVLPSVDEQPTDDGATGTLDLVITDPQNRLVKVEGKSRSGNGDEEENWQTLSLAGGTYTDTVDLALKHPSTIRYRITHYDEDGNEIAHEKVVPFPLASKPAKPIVTLSIDGEGNVTAHLEGDPDTAKFRAAGSDSAYPNAATVDAQTPISGQSVDTGTLVTIGTDETAYVSAKAYTSGEVGSDLAKAKLTAISEELEAPPDPPSSVELTASVTTTKYVDA